MLAARHDEVFAAQPGTEAAGAEVLDLLADHLPKRFPTQYPRMNTTIAVAATGDMVGIGAPGVHPLETAARLVPEDLCLMRRIESGYVLAAACVCFPSRWRLADKIGRSLAAIRGRHRELTGQRGLAAARRTHQQRTSAPVQPTAQQRVQGRHPA